MNHVFRDCVELHPQAGRYVPGPLVFPRDGIASLTIESLFSPSPSSGSVRAPSLAPCTPCLRPPPPLPLIGWSTLEPPSTPVLPSAHYPTTILHSPPILHLLLWGTVLPSRSPQ
ncbi:hypothetical protein Zm00014a_040309 [Zea mays]|uniref:Uncharacterized protein n=1 Tax=Zea mays TaxID=4577 RepID=A0A3L6DER7_MAIZE|nr:hypothetical protein Zm00014a_040309 [Zea mays]